MLGVDRERYSSPFFYEPRVDATIAPLPLPETALDAIQRYPLPEQLPADRRYSSLCYFTPTAQPPQCGTLRHIQPTEGHHAA